LYQSFDSALHSSHLQQFHSSPHDLWWRKENQQKQPMQQSNKHALSFQSLSHHSRCNNFLLFVFNLFHNTQLQDNELGKKPGRYALPGLLQFGYLEGAGATGFSAFFFAGAFLEPFSPTSFAACSLWPRFFQIPEDWVLFRYGVAQSTDLSASNS
jgi:hypothetical protein